MLSPTEVVDKDFLEHRHMLLELAAYLDRYDSAVARSGETLEKPLKLKIIDQALEILHAPPSEQGRTIDLLTLFAKI